MEILGYKEMNRKAAFSEKVKQDVEDYLVESTVRMHIYRVLPFQPRVNHADHLAAVKTVSLLEKYVIAAFRSSGKPLMNRMVSKPIKACPYPELLFRIKSEFGLQ
jgi:hypothetical protein